MLQNIFKTKSRSKRRRGQVPRPTYKSMPGSSKFGFNSKKVIKIASYLFLFIVVLVIITGVFALKAYLKWDLKNPTTWDGRSKQNILIIGVDEKENEYLFADMAMLVTISPKQGKLGIFSIDPDILFSSPSGDKTTIRKAYNLDFGMNSGVENIEYGVEQILAVEIDKYIMLSEQDFITMQQLIGRIDTNISKDILEEDYDYKGSPLFIKSGNHTLNSQELLGVLSADANGVDPKLNLHNKTVEAYIGNFGSISSLRRVILHLDMLNDLETNLSKKEFFDLYRFFIKLNLADIRIGYTQQNSLNPNTEGKQAYVDRLDEDVQSIFLDLNILKEQSRLEVLNGTSKSGVAGKYSRFFNNSGIRVVRYGNAVKGIEETTLFIPEKSKYPYTLEQISGVFDGKIVIIEEEYKYKHVGDIVLVIGEDFVRE